MTIPCTRRLIREKDPRAKSRMLQMYTHAYTLVYKEREKREKKRPRICTFSNKAHGIEWMTNETRGACPCPKNNRATRLVCEISAFSLPQALSVCVCVSHKVYMPRARPCEMMLPPTTWLTRPREIKCRWSVDRNSACARELLHDSECIYTYPRL